MLEKRIIRIPGMLLIGSSGRNSGKTHLACSVIRNNCRRVDIFGLKVTTIKEKNGPCPRGGEGCGVCASLEGDYCLTWENNRYGQKDTSLLLQAGAEKVLWLRVLQDRLKKGVDALIKEIPKNVAFVVESNRLRLAVEPDLFIMVANAKSTIKPSAALVWDKTDVIIQTNGRKFDHDIDKILFTGKKWTL